MAEFKNPNPPHKESGRTAAPVPRLHKKKGPLHSHDATRPAHTDAVADINITPLIDVMLVLLIIFMVVTPLAQRGLDIALPAPDTQKQNEPQRQPGNEVVLSVEEAPGGGSAGRTGWRSPRKAPRSWSTTSVSAATGR